MYHSDTVTYTGYACEGLSSHTFEDGDKVKHGQTGEVVGPAMSASHVGKGVCVRFPGNEDDIACFLTQLSRSAPISNSTGAASHVGEAR